MWVKQFFGTRQFKEKTMERLFFWKRPSNRLAEAMYGRIHHAARYVMSFPSVWIAAVSCVVIGMIGLNAEVLLIPQISWPITVGAALGFAAYACFAVLFCQQVELRAIRGWINKNGDAFLQAAFETRKGVRVWESLYIIQRLKKEFAGWSVLVVGQGKIVDVKNPGTVDLAAYMEIRNRSLLQPRLVNYECYENSTAKNTIWMRLGLSTFLGCPAIS
jgi:hypothetical protein